MKITQLQSLGAGIILGWIIQALIETALPGGQTIEEGLQTYGQILAAFVVLFGGSLAYRAAMSKLDHDKQDLAQRATLQGKALDTEFDARLRAVTNRIIPLGRSIRFRGLDAVAIEYTKVQLVGPADRLASLIDRIWQKLADVDPAISAKLTGRAIRGETIVRNLRSIVDGVGDTAPDHVDDLEILRRLVETLNVIKSVDDETTQMVETRLKALKTKMRKRPSDFSMFDQPTDDDDSETEVTSVERPATIIQE